MDVFSLTGQVALVTGGARGIGRAIATLLATQGANVVIVDYADARETVAQLEHEVPGGTFACQYVDVRDPEQVRRSVRDVVDSFGQLTILVNNAGTASRSSLDSITEDEWDRDIDTNTRGAFRYIQAAVYPYMRDQGTGRIINVSSISGFMGGPLSGGSGIGRSGPSYAASKGGIIALTKWVAKEVGELGITCNSVAPGPVATEMTRSANYALDHQVIKRMGKPEEIAAAVGYLASPGAAYVTGQVLSVCGGAAIG
ncbi:3-oxoacyl-[acyl-carrier protein] reductase [Tamaricihabitans halophyticus]|uniref:3-oxoacyl-[acyl-carrier protein] reductase n=1 Tax=Tamaricihabitans halophyticus TaxID=1262583 RepID=A0A4R2QU98_9PSEU|nr:SDR family NAD(P)-dependent oxidoreductase [Tamaricihabitans halophyticus]TCP53552.1 3-oxoacyl-[acyl-carrier protein] reductase [Tamaricihabitans halophyticus]